MTSVQDNATAISPSRPAAGPVLLVSPWYKPTLGGITQVASRLLRCLRTYGAPTSLLVCDETGQERFPDITADPHERDVWRFTMPSGPFYRLSPQSLAGFAIRGPQAHLKLLWFIRRHGFRTLLVIYPFAFAWPFAGLCRQCGVKLIASYHGTEILKHDDYSALSRRVCRRMLTAADAIIVSAAHLADKAHQIVPGRPLPIRLIPNAVDVAHFHPPQVPQSSRPLTFIHMSNFAPKKRVCDIIAAFAKAGIPGSRLTLVGNGTDYDNARATAVNLGLGDLVAFTGPIEDVRPLLWQADVLVTASDEESGPLALLEAMACGLPWIATPWGIAAMLGGGECGLLAPARDPGQLASAMVALAGDPQRRRRMGALARQRVVAGFSEEAYAQRHLELIAAVEAEAAIAERV